MKGRILVLFVLILLSLTCLPSFAHGARVYGTIYDTNLDTVSSVVVEANSTPIQRHISKYGGYSFELQPGTYDITATLTINGTSKLVAQEAVKVVSEEGEYIVDLFIFPEVNLDVGFTPTPFWDWQTSALFIFAFITSLALVLLAILWFRGKSSGQIVSSQTSEVDSTDVQYTIEYASEAQPSSEESKQDSAVVSDRFLEEDSKLKKRILQLITDNSGEMTQKDIRKNIDLSEAKISQVLSDLTKDKKIKKVKKGRSNVIVLT